MRKKFNRSIALVVPALNFAGGEFFQEIIRGIDAVVEKSNFTLVISKFYGQENSFQRITKENRIDGAIVFGDIFTWEELQAMNEYKIPITITNYRLEKPLKNIIDIYSDNEYGGKMVTEHLITKHNRKNILFLGGGDRYQANKLRKSGFIQIANQYNINNRIMDGKFETGFDDGEQILFELIKNREFSFDAIFAASDTLAMGALNILQRNNIRVPQDVSIISYDNTQITNFYPIPITSVEQKAYTLGYKSAEIILNQIVQKEKQFASTSIKITPELILRESCGCL